MRDRLDGLWCDEDFADWYPRDGRPGLSPSQLATVCVLQFLLGLSDRQATEAVRCRIDFKCAPFHSASDRSRREPRFGRSHLGAARLTRTRKREGTTAWRESAECGRAGCGTAISANSNAAATAAPARNTRRRTRPAIGTGLCGSVGPPSMGFHR
nr:transposase [Embleya scabrispora]